MKILWSALLHRAAIIMVNFGPLAAEIDPVVCATYIPQGGHHVGHWPTFLVQFVLVT